MAKVSTVHEWAVFETANMTAEMGIGESVELISAHHQIKMLVIMPFMTEMPFMPEGVLIIL